MEHPTPTGHLIVSLLKSCIRIAASITLCMGSLGAAGLGFLFAELLGIVEELV